MGKCGYCNDVDDTIILYGKPQKILGEIFDTGIFISVSKPRTLHCFVGDEYVYKKKNIALCVVENWRNKK